MTIIERTKQVKQAKQNPSGQPTETGKAAINPNSTTKKEGMNW
jgi:hypothetical protein